MTITLTNEQTDALQDFVLDYDVTIRERYSGRGMHGNCLGFLVDDPHSFLIKLGAFLNIEYTKDCPGLFFVQDSFHNVRVDSMGRRTIVYFPDVSWPEDDENE